MRLINAASSCPRGLTRFPFSGRMAKWECRVAPLAIPIVGTALSANDLKGYSTPATHWVVHNNAPDTQRNQAKRVIAAYKVNSVMRAAVQDKT